MAGREPSVRWNETAQRWMAWVRFPDGSRRKVERVDQREAEQDLAELLEMRERAEPPGRRRTRLVTFTELFDSWMAAGSRNVTPSGRRRHASTKSDNTIVNVKYSIEQHLRPCLGPLRVDRISTEQLEDRFGEMDRAGYATSTIHHAWLYLNQACQFGLRRRMISSNPAADVLLPAAKPSKVRKSIQVEHLEPLLLEAIPRDPRPAMWLTGLMCGLRPGELVGLRWRFVDIDGDTPTIEVAERAKEVNQKYVGQAPPKRDAKGPSSSTPWSSPP